MWCWMSSPTSPFFAVEPKLADKLLQNSEYRIDLKKPTTGFASLDFMAMLDFTWYEQQLARTARGKPINPNMSAWVSVLKTFYSLGAYALSAQTCLMINKTYIAESEAKNTASP